MDKAEPPTTLPPDALYRRHDPAKFSFETTDELEPLDRVVGQERAVEAIRFGIGIKHDGYNLYALGPPGTGKHTIVREFLERDAAQCPVPPDWCYVNNFEAPHKPLALSLPAGRAGALREAMDGLIEELRSAIPAAFESEEYANRRQMIETEFRRRHEAVLEKIQERAKDKNVALMQTPVGFVFAPIREGEVLSPQDFNKLPAAEQESIKREIEELQKELEASLRQMPILEKEQRNKLRELNQDVMSFAVGHLIDAIRETFNDLPEVLTHLDAVQHDLVRNVFDFLRATAQQERAAGAGAPGQVEQQADSFGRYRVNVIVDHAATEGAPVVYEDHPTLGNVMGRVEHTSQFGTLVTDFNLIKPGALHKGNGGYLVLDARKVLMQPMVWEELKRTIRSKEIRMESLGQLIGLVSTVSLDPQPIPLDTKIVLVGDRMIYFLLSAYDPDFPALFKVPADFDAHIDLTEENAGLYARLIATMAKDEKLRPVDRGGVARMLEHGSRLLSDSEKLSIEIQRVFDLLREADYWAGAEDSRTIGAHHVQKAIDAQIRRSDRVREAMYEQISRGTILIDTEGEAVGQVNALSVLQLGTFAFGKPSRITARVRMGKGEVIDIERRVELGGPLHSKGVLILSGFLGARYAKDKPLSLSASLVFEQSYGGVDGDSASSTELYALLSALAELPIKQSLAVTGSVNQYGQVQAIGGVNEKIEGFFDICVAKGLTDGQGVLIPASNVKHLMLRSDVVEAARAGTFHIYPVETVDQGIEILTGVPAGVADESGAFPEGTVNHRVSARLDEFAAAAKRFAPGQPGPEESNEEPNAEAGGAKP